MCVCVCVCGVRVCTCGRKRARNRMRGYVCVCTRVRAYLRWSVPDEDRHDQCPGQRDGAGLQRLDALDVRYFCVDLFFVEK